MNGIEIKGKTAVSQPTLRSPCSYGRHLLPTPNAARPNTERTPPCSSYMMVRSVLKIEAASQRVDARAKGAAAHPALAVELLTVVCYSHQALIGCRRSARLLQQKRIDEVSSQAECSLNGRRTHGWRCWNALRTRSQLPP